LNEFANNLLTQRKEGKPVQLTIGAEESERLLDLVDRTKATLMLLVWSEEWGDRNEFRKWVVHTPGSPYSDPPARIAQAAAIYKGESQ
jgi:hypothetical protein